MATLNQIISEVVAGNTVRGFMTWALPASAQDVASSRVVWDLIDPDGRVYNSGDGEAVEVSPHATDPGKFIFKAYANMGIPSNLPVANGGTKYQIAWTLEFSNGRGPSTAFDQITVMAPEYNVTGAIDSVDLFTDQTEVNIRLPIKPIQLSLSIYRGNNQVLSRTNITDNPIETDEGWLYKIPVNPGSMDGNQASLAPLSVTWKYKLQDSDAPLIETSNLWLVNPSMLTAMRDLEMFLNRAYIDSGIAPGTTFNPSDLFRHLRKGADMFNAAVRPTNFYMTNATNGIRQFWLAYSSIDACRAQFLAEGMKAFNFSGQATSLEVDRSPFWDQTASSLQSEVDQQIKPFKDNLAKWGALGGDGNVLGPRPGSVGNIGISLSPLTPLRGNFGGYVGLGMRTGQLN